MKLFILIILLFSVGLVEGQEFDYTINSYVDEYNELIDPVSLNNNEIWFLPDYTIPLPFDFLFFQTHIDTLFFFPEGAGCILSDSQIEGGIHRLIIPFGSSLIDRGFGSGSSQSPLSYEVTGNPGDQIFKIQWGNAGFLNEYDALGTLNDYINFQLWLYEADGRIDVRYGTYSITHPELAFIEGTGPSVGLIPEYDYTFDLISDSSIWLINTPENPDLIYSGELEFLDYMTQPDWVFEFSNLTTSAPAIENGVMSISPNPVIDQMYLRSTNNNINTYFRVSIYNSVGFLVTKQNIRINEPCNVGFLPKGVYFCVIKDNRGHMEFSKLIKL